MAEWLRAVVLGHHATCAETVEVIDLKPCGQTKMQSGNHIGGAKWGFRKEVRGQDAVACEESWDLALFLTHEVNGQELLNERPNHKSELNIKHDTGGNHFKFR